MKKILALLMILLVPALVLGATFVVVKAPANAKNFLATGNVLFQQGDYSEAKAVYERAVELDPELEPALNNLAFIYNQEKEYGKAASMLSRLVLIDPTKTEHHYDYAVNLIMEMQKTGKGTIEEIELAITEFMKADGLEPGFQKSKENTAFLEDLRAQYYQAHAE
ncbi:MAG: tetratricopeptide repeat protein [archaeon]